MFRFQRVLSLQSTQRSVSRDHQVTNNPVREFLRHGVLQQTHVSSRQWWLANQSKPKRGSMTIFNIRFVLVAILALSVAACGRSGSNTSAANDADNTARNERDNNDTAKTPVDQSENADD